MEIELVDLIPHQGPMCLLDCVESWNEDGIVCRATSHHRPDHPLRDRSGLRGLCAIEYGAQAIAAHAGLMGTSADSKAPIGFIAAARDIVVAVARLDDIEEPLTIRADVVLRQGTGHVYEIAVTAGAHIVLTGRLSIIVPPAMERVMSSRIEHSL
jgi:predicted hotdog family 3-hydroxylacyl-ACP dehydratase